MNQSERDIGLDWIRVSGLLLMVCTHYFERQPHDTPIAEALLTLVEAAPAYFFFAFGMTSCGFAKRPSDEKRESMLLLLYLVLAHNLYMWRLLVLGDFMFFLFASRLVLLLVEESFEKPARIVACGFAALLTWSLVLRDAAALSLWSQETVGGHFTLVPWILFPAAGYLYRAFRPERVTGLCAGIAAIAAGTLLDYYAEAAARPSWVVVKWPLTGAYLLFHAGLVIVVLESVNALRRFALAIPGLAWGLEAISSRLLTATALHYLGLHFAFFVTTKLAWLQPDAGNEFEQVRTFVLGCGLCLAALFALLWLGERAWERWRLMRVLVALRTRSGATALLILASFAVINNHPARLWLQSNGWDPKLGKYLALAAMVYFAYELADWQRYGRRRPPAPA